MRLRLRGRQLEAINAALKNGTAEDFNAALQKTCAQAEGIGQFAAAPGSAENVCLPNDTKIRFCNAFDAIKEHCILCKECDMYLRWGDGDLCSAGKTIIAMELCFTDTSIEFPPNTDVSDPRRA